jgi:cytochrome c oxidase assembly protein Cox11
MAITISPGSNHGTLDGTTPVTLVAAPSSGTTRIVLSIRIVNKDTVAHNIRVRKAVGGTDYEFSNALALDVDEEHVPVDREQAVFLTATNQSITAVMGEAVTSVNPHFVASYIDRVVT